MVNDSMAMVAPIAHERGIRLVDIGGDGRETMVRADHTRLQQVLINLLANAIKYNRPQGTVHLACHSGKGIVRISITDSGDGKVLLVGAEIDRLTLWHALEEKLESRLPISPFTRERFELVSRLPDGTTRTTSTRLFEPAVSRRRNLFTLMPELSRLNGWRETRLGELKLVLLKARDVERAAVNLAEQGVSCYD